MKKLTILIITALIGVGVAGADEKLLITGVGKSVREATVNALASALEQKYGLTMSSAEKSSISSSDSFVSENNNSTSIISNRDRLENRNATWSEGKIKSYRNVSQSFNPADRTYSVVLEVYFPGRYVVGLNPDNRRRMVVGKFFASTYKFSAFGQTLNGQRWISHFSDSLNVHLTQSRKFTMLDRKFDSVIDRELERLSANNASPDDVIRLNQKLGTDYLVTGTITFRDIPPLQKNPFTGEVLPPANVVFARIHYRVLLAATGQLKWADTIELDTARFYEALVNNSSPDAAAAIVAGGLISSILPFETVAFSPDGTIVIGEGGKSLIPGEFFSVYALGKEVKDSRTGEVIDQIEVRVGMVKIVRVTEKLSYAILIQGDKKNIPVGSRLRRDDFSRASERQAAPEPEYSPANTTVKTTPAGGVVVTF